MLQKIRNNPFIKDIGITTIGQILLMVFAFAINKVVCIFLSVPDYAIYNIIRRGASVITYVMLMAMGIAVPKYLSMAQEEGDQDKFARYLIASIEIVMVASVVVGLALCLGKQQSVNLLFPRDESDYSVYIKPLAFYSAGCAFTTYVYSYYRAVGAFVRYTLAQLGMQAFMLVSCFVIQEDLLKLINIWAIVSCAYSAITIGVILKKNCRPKAISKKTESKGILKELLVYGLPRVPGEFFLFAYNLVPTLLFTSKFGLIQSSYFSVAVSLNSTITSLFGFVGIVLLPEVSKAIVSRNLKDIGKKIRILLLIYVLLAVCAIALVEILPHFVIWILYSSEYYEAIPIVRILCLAVLPNALYLLYRNPLDAISKFPYNTVCLAVSFVMMIVMMQFTDTILACELIYVGSYVVLGVASFVMWNICLNREIHHAKESDLRGEE